MSWDHKQSTKEVVKHLLYKLGVHDILKIYRNRRGFVTKHLEARDPAERRRPGPVRDGSPPAGCVLPVYVSASRSTPGLWYV